MKLFWRNSIKSRLPTMLKQQKQTILKVINSFRVQFCLKIALFSQFSAGPDTRTNYSNFFILGKSRFPPKRVLQHRLLQLGLLWQDGCKVLLTYRRICEFPGRQGEGVGLIGAHLVFDTAHPEARPNANAVPV